ncbi:immunity 22 family protein [Pedobacter gandavensis]|uniref:immunity 22 family protein n=1 Tax=Pedobacter gandavensis TaxID=2679963 RepID=UPI00292FFD64|nr:immunity 22 family protein [Pedobacter gandavensis]
MAEQRVHIWAGTTNKTEEQFYKYFDQTKFLKDNHLFNTDENYPRSSPDFNMRSQFSKAIDKQYDYDAKWITIFFSRKRISIQAAIEELPIWNDKTEVEIYQACVNKGISAVNVILCYADNDLKIDKPLDNYNDMSYVGCFSIQG